MISTAAATSASQPEIPLTGEAWRFFVPLALATSYQWFLCFGTNFGLPASRALIAAAELALIVLILSLGKYTFSSRQMGAALVILTYMSLLWVLRGAEIDIKALRDILIPMIAFWFGTRVRLDNKDIDRGLLLLATIVAAIGLFEYTNFYSTLINTFTYHAQIGIINEGDAMIEGQTVTLNGLRPEGIGRTLFTALLGQQRISSVFLEPIAMGNFGVIVAAWALAKPTRDWKVAAALLIAAIVLISLADSRFGIATIFLMCVFRFALTTRLATAVAAVLPVVAALGTVVTSMLTDEAGDNFAGRLVYSGKRLLELDALSFMGVTGFDLPFWDTGYAYVITRFGLPLLVALWVCLFLIPAKSEVFSRFRVNISLYLSLILCISGTSAFAFKTSVILWSLVGVSTRLHGKPSSDDAMRSEAHAEFQQVNSHI